jgi:hypothetical protein
MTRALGFAAVVGLIFLSACVDTAAIKSFANESSVISSDAGVISGSDAAFDAVKPYLNSPEMAKEFPDALSSGPGTPEFDDAKKLSGPAGKVLQQYMQALAKLAGDTNVISSGDVSGIEASLKGLGITSDKVTPALDATSKLANLIVAGYAQGELEELVDKSNDYVQTITAFLTKFAEENATLYDKARIVSGVYWQNRVHGCEVAKSSPPVGCDAIIALATRVHAQDGAILKQQVNIADAAAAAFQEIGADHQAIVDSAGKLDSARLINVLNTNEPVLVGAIRDLSKL